MAGGSFANNCTLVATATASRTNGATRDSVCISFIHGVMGDMDFSRRVVRNTPDAAIALDPAISNAKTLAIPAMEAYVCGSSSRGVTAIGRRNIMAFVGTNRYAVATCTISNNISTSMGTVAAGSGATLSTTIGRCTSMGCVSCTCSCNVTFGTTCRGTIGMGGSCLSARSTVSSTFTTLRATCGRLTSRPFVTTNGLTFTMGNRRITGNTACIGGRTGRIIMDTSYTRNTVVGSSALACTGTGSMDISISNGATAVAGSGSTTFNSISLSCAIISSCKHRSAMAGGVGVASGIRLVRSFGFICGKTRARDISCGTTIITGGAIRLSVGACPRTTRTCASVG